MNIEGEYPPPTEEEVYEALGLRIDADGSVHTKEETPPPPTVDTVPVSRPTARLSKQGALAIVFGAMIFSLFAVFLVANVNNAAEQRQRQMEESVAITIRPTAVATLIRSPQLVTIATQSSRLTNTELPCDRILFVKDVTVEDGKVFLPEDRFTKTWRLQNYGSCTWNINYELVFDHGDNMGAPDSISLTDNVAPGQYVDLSVDMLAPGLPGTYKGFWMLRNASGDKFGLGDKANVAFWVEIEIER